MSQYLRKNIAALAAYVPGEQPRDGGYVKLNTNENPYPPSPRVLTAVRKATNLSLRLYPEPTADTLRTLAASTYGVEVENILAGNGSDELLSMLIRCLVGPGDPVVYPVPTYSLYDTLIAIQDGEKVEIPFGADFSLPAEIFSHRAPLTFVCNPNSPSGTLVSLQEIERLARAVSGILVVDEAYIDFADVEGCSAIPLIQSFSNIVVLRSFSKSFSLAGMRIGLAFAAREIIAGMIKVKDSYNVTRLSLVAAAAALQDIPWMKRNVRRIQRSRHRLTRGLKKLGFQIYPAQANFVMARMPARTLRGLYEELKRRKILVRYFATPGLEDSLRISVGTDEEIKILLREIEEIEGRPVAGGREEEARSKEGQAAMDEHIDTDTP
ncbi:MAG: histidinol-phosphate transaminase [Deltaproteobacteria bacterium]|nr:histidinol-phosphate transaminase [Deltaproteobacteria bacterium]